MTKNQSSTAYMTVETDFDVKFSDLGLKLLANLPKKISGYLKKGLFFFSCSIVDVDVRP